MNLNVKLFADGAEDLDLWLRVSSVGEIGCLPHIIIYLRGDKNVIIKKRRLFNCVACVCYHRQRLGLSDPAETLEYTKWQEFLEWIDDYLKRDYYYESQQVRINLLKLWRDNEKPVMMVKIMKILIILINDHLARKIFLQRIIPRYFAKLAKDSRDLF